MEELNRPVLGERTVVRRSSLADSRNRLTVYKGVRPKLEKGEGSIYKFSMENIPRRTDTTTL